MTDSVPSAQVAPAFRERVLALVARIPEGRVMTYGQLALLAGNPGAARQAGFVMNSLVGGVSVSGDGLPWHRVINAQGRVSTHKVGFGDMQEGLLRAEGVELDSTGRCDLAARQWWPEEERGAPPTPLL
ncbi:methylated-DNA--protein-cysteine methyltransferase [Deinococcus seoulensis]|uniref:Methylated-DNA--protein-cysteine methyltransferase n=2 Tax=Deinococcus TaxID=1298 RepID=A0ABQ2RS30_9DEIO|nr:MULTISPECIES: MGMT family protein [Deinococcus]GGR56850.1 methylated-DNA--protein-cysteine methyltransferase [Deinococcus seoulensis]GGS29798.1 methylated-DNA--protein-cysteine methyltransferase [Deinococcus knuensis]